MPRPAHALLLALAATPATLAATSYSHDGETTYCWSIPQSYDVATPKDSANVISAQGDDCPVAVRMALSASKVHAGDTVPVSWTVTLERARLSDNALNVAQYYQMTDPVSGEQVDIIAANLRTCAETSRCDPFSMGTGGIADTPTMVAQFGGKSTVKFTSSDELSFPSVGEYTVMAHVIMPGSNGNKRLDYAVFQTLSVVDDSEPTDTGSDDDGAGLSTVALVLIILGALLVVAIIVAVVLWWRKKKKHQNHNMGMATPAPYHGGSPRSLDKTYDRYPAINSHSTDAKIDAPVAAPYNHFSNSGSTASHSGSGYNSSGDDYVASLGGSGSGSGSGSGARNKGSRVRGGGAGAGARGSKAPALYNQESSSSQFLESTRSYQYENSNPPRREAPTHGPPKIYDTQNSVDFVYPDTDHSIDMVDTGFDTGLVTGDMLDSARSVDTNDSCAGFVVESSRTFDFEDTSRRSSHDFALDTNSSSEFGVFDESTRSQDYDYALDTNTSTISGLDDSTRSFEFNENDPTETHRMTTQQLRKMTVEI